MEKTFVLRNENREVRLTALELIALEFFAEKNIPWYLDNRVRRIDSRNAGAVADLLVKSRPDIAECQYELAPAPWSLLTPEEVDELVTFLREGEFEVLPSN